MSLAQVSCLNVLPAAYGRKADFRSGFAKVSALHARSGKVEFGGSITASSGPLRSASIVVRAAKKSDEDEWNNNPWASVIPHPITPIESELFELMKKGGDESAAAVQVQTKKWINEAEPEEISYEALVKVKFMNVVSRTLEKGFHPLKSVYEVQQPETQARIKEFIEKKMKETYPEWEAEFLQDVHQLYPGIFSVPAYCKWVGFGFYEDEFSDESLHYDPLLVMRLKLLFNFKDEGDYPKALTHYPFGKVGFLYDAILFGIMMGEVEDWFKEFGL